VPGTTRVLLAAFDLVVPEEPLAHEKLCPVLGLVRVPTARRGIDAARAVLRISGRGHSAAIHSSDPRMIMEYGAAVEVLRVSVNAGNSLGSSGIETHLPPSMTVGTGFFGGSSVGENLQPAHFVQWTRLAYNSDPAEPFGNFSGLIPWESPAGPVPPYPYASNMAEAGGRRDGYPSPAHRTPLPGAPVGDPFVAGGAGTAPGTATAGSGFQQNDLAGLREEIRRLVIEELSQLVGGSHG
jgi:hypothetical protein